jgi:hypothetical protein
MINQHQCSVCRDVVDSLSATSVVDIKLQRTIVDLLQLDNQHQWSACRDDIDSVPATFVVAEAAMRHCAHVFAAGQTTVPEAAVCHCAPVCC